MDKISATRLIRDTFENSFDKSRFYPIHSGSAEPL